MSPEELAALCKAYHENKKEIEKLIAEQLNAGVEQFRIAAKFGLTPTQVYRRAQKIGVRAYKSRWDHSAPEGG